MKPSQLPTSTKEYIMTDSQLKDEAYAAVRLLKKRNDRTIIPLVAYIEELEREVFSTNHRMAHLVVAHLKDFERLASDWDAAQKRALAEAEATQALPPISPREYIMEAIARAEAIEAEKAAANAPWWKFWAASSGGDPAAKEETK